MTDRHLPKHTSTSAENTRRVIDRSEDLDALPAKSVVLDQFDDVWQKDSDGDFQTAGGWLPSEKLINLRGPVTVIYTPEETA